MLSGRNAWLPTGRAKLALLAGLVAAPSLATGLFLDDYILIDRLRRQDWPFPSVRGLTEAFRFVGGPEELLRLRELGYAPWWTNGDLRFSFFRPLAALSHTLDLLLFPESPWLMHLVSVGWLVGLTWAAIAWFERLFAELPQAARLASALYALSPGHIFAASWISNRNAVMAALFGVLSLLAHDRARCGEGVRFKLASPLLLLASLLSAELGLSSVALLIAHALCLDRGSLRSRVLALVPALLVIAGWAALYVSLHSGAQGAAYYHDPLRAPGAYLQGLLTSLPVLLFGQWFLPVASLMLVLSRAGQVAFAVVSALGLVAIAPLVLRVVARDPRARFCLVAGLLSLLPVASTVPHDRLLVVADLGMLGLVACCVARAQEVARPRAGWALGAISSARLALGLPLALGHIVSLFQNEALQRAPFEHDLREPEVSAQTLIFVNPPCAPLNDLLGVLRSYTGGPSPRRMRDLAPGVYPLEVRRIDERTLSVRSEYGLLQPPGTYRAPGLPQNPLASPLYVAQIFNQPSHVLRVRAGDRMHLSELEIEMLDVTSDQAPREVQFRFPAALEAPEYRFLRWQDRHWLPFALPRVGGRVTLPATLTLH